MNDPQPNVMANIAGTKRSAEDDAMSLQHSHQPAFPMDAGPDGAGTSFEDPMAVHAAVSEANKRSRTDSNDQVVAPAVIMDPATYAAVAQATVGEVRQPQQHVMHAVAGLGAEGVVMPHQGAGNEQIGPADHLLNHQASLNVSAANVRATFDASSRDRWMMKLGELRMYKAVHGTCNVPRNCKACPQLGKWVNNQRFEYKKLTQGKPSKMTEERILMLEAEGFTWSITEHVPWETRYEQLVAYKTENNHCRVPKRNPKNQALANWVDKQRKEFKLMQAGKKNSMTAERVELLNKLGFVWIATADIPWETRIEQLKEYKKLHGNCLVPNKYREENGLGRWVDKQRQDYRKLKEGKKSVMTPERIAELDSIGFCWSVDEYLWNVRFEELKEYRESKGNCLVPHNYLQNPQLANWVIQQRQELKKLSTGRRSAMKAERFNKLNTLNFEWNAGRSSSSIVVQTVPMERAISISQAHAAHQAMMAEMMQAHALAQAQVQAQAQTQVAAQQPYVGIAAPVPAASKDYQHDQDQAVITMEGLHEAAETESNECVV